MSESTGRRGGLGNWGEVSCLTESATGSLGWRSCATPLWGAERAVARPGNGTAVLVGLGCEAPEGAGRVVRLESGGPEPARCRADSARTAFAGTKGVGKSLSRCSNVAMR